MLVDTPRWIAWRYAWKRTKDGGRKLDKPPVDPVTGHPWDIHDPAHWRAVDDALALAAEHGRGVGLVLDGSDGLVGVDIDHCVDDDGALTAEAAALVADFASYAELSPSGHGVRIFCVAVLPDDGHKRGELELYQRGRYLTVTGRRLPGTPAAVRPAQAAAIRLWKRLARSAEFNDNNVNVETRVLGNDRGDEAILAAIRATDQAAKLDRLMNGDTGGHGGDHSSADAALVAILCGYTDDDGQVERLWQRSRLAERDKFKRADYRDRTIAFARKRQTWRYAWPAPEDAGDDPAPIISRDTSCPELVPRLAAAEAEAERWRTAYEGMREIARRRHRKLLLYEQTDAHPQFRGRQRAVGALAEAIAAEARRTGRATGLRIAVGATEKAAGLAEKQITKVVASAEAGGAIACDRPNRKTAGGHRKQLLVSIGLAPERAVDPTAVHAHLIGRTARAPRLGKGGKEWGGDRPSCRRCGPDAIVVHERADTYRCTCCNTVIESRTREVARYRNGDERPILWPIADGPTADPRRLPAAVAGLPGAAVDTPDGPGVLALIDPSGAPLTVAVDLAAGGRRDYPADDVTLHRQVVGGNLGETPVHRQLVGVVACAGCGAPPTRADAGGRPLCGHCLTRLDRWFGSEPLPPATSPPSAYATGAGDD
jgi:primase-polymerase (primpol)-like protein